MEGGAAACLPIILLEREMGIRYPVLCAYRFFPATFLFGWNLHECLFINFVIFLNLTLKFQLTWRRW
jgi:hypothetical protein